MTEAEITALVEERDKLLAFKAFVHDRLTAAGVPTHPDGPHSRQGCRIGDRLDLVLGADPPVGTDGKYGTIYCTGKQFHPGEPVFLIRATDRNAHNTLTYYAQVCAKDRCSPEHVDAVVDHAVRIYQWQKANPTLVKQPD